MTINQYFEFELNITYSEEDVTSSPGLVGGGIITHGVGSSYSSCIAMANNKLQEFIDNGLNPHSINISICKI